MARKRLMVRTSAGYYPLAAIWGISDGDTKMQGMGSGQGFWTLLSQDEQNTLRNLGLSRDYSPG